MTTDPLELVDYPAVAPPDTQRTIDSFLAACTQVRESHHDDQRRARIGLAVSLADRLRARRDELEPLLRDGHRWLDAHPDDDDDAQWFAAESEYRAICDALVVGAREAFGSVADPVQAMMEGMA